MPKPVYYETEKRRWMWLRRKVANTLKEEKASDLGAFCF